jgi:2-iminobutanoate/2-iminopropanoate deaminase
LEGDAVSGRNAVGRSESTATLRGLEYVSTPKAPQSRAPLSQAVISDGLVFTAGLVGVNPRTGQLAEGVEAQTRQTLDNLDAVLTAAGSSLMHTIKVTIFVRDVGLLSQVNTVYGEFFTRPWPARSALEARMADDKILVEIEAVARRVAG